MKKIFNFKPTVALWCVLLVMVMVLLPSISAFSFTATEDFIKDETTSIFGKYQIYEKDLYLFKGDLLVEHELEQNTFNCGNGLLCEAYFTSSLIKDGTLVDKWNIYNADTMKPDTMRWYKLQYYGDVIDYTTECSILKEIGLEEEIIGDGKVNETNEVCVEVESGSHKEWIDFSEGQIFKAGNYEWRAIGDKAGWKNIEWTFVKDGIETIEWSTWGAYGSGNSYVNLTSPADGSIQLFKNVTTNATGVVIGGATLTNVTLYDNSTGTWGARNTSTIGIIGTYSNFVLTRGSDATESASPRAGLSFTVLNNSIINNVTKQSSCTATTAYLYVSTDADSGNLLATANFTGDKAVFNYPINTSSTYFVLAGEYSGASYTRTLSSSAVTYPQTNNQIRVNGFVILDSGGLQTNNYRNIVEIATTNSSNFTSSSQAYINTFNAGQSVLWNYQFCDSDGACGFATANRTFSIDTGVPEITLNYPTSLINYGSINGTLQLNITVTHDNLDKVWYNYNGTNITLTGAVSGVANISNITLSTKKNVTIYANDTVGNLNTTTFSWDYYVFETASSYSQSVAEGTSSTFTANLTLSPTYRLSAATLHYNGETTSGTATEVSTNNWVISASRVAPSVTSDTNYTFYWTLRFENAVEINSSSNYQTVINIAIDNCSSYSNQLFNFTMVDEDSQVPLNGTDGNVSTLIRIDMQFKNPVTNTIVINYSALYNQTNRTNPARICSGSSIGNSTFRVDAQVQYSSIGRFTEYYYIQNYSLNTSTTNQNITLYDLNSTSTGLEFKINYKDSNFNNKPGAVVQIKRKYIDEGVYKIVELPVISSEGYAIAHLIPASQVYSLVFIENGTILGSFDDIVAYCPNPTFTECTLTLNSYGSSITPGDLNEDGDFSSTLTYNKTSRTITATFLIPSGTTQTVILNATKANALGTTVACNDTLVASGGTLYCTIPSTIGNTTIKVYLTADGVVKRWFVMTLTDRPKTLFTTSLVFLAVVMLLFFIGIGVQQDPKIMAITMILGIVVMTAINLITTKSWIGTGATILWFVLAMVIILIKSGNNR